MSLTDKQRIFALEYLVDLNATQAAIRAGYSEETARSIGSENLTKPDVREFIDAALAKREARLELKSDTVIRELLRVALVDIGGAYGQSGKLLHLHEMPEDVRRAIAGIDIEEMYDGTGEARTHVGDVVKVKFWDKMKGLELLGKHLQLFTDTLHVKHVDPLAEALADIPPDKRLEYIDRLALKEKP